MTGVMGRAGIFLGLCGAIMGAAFVMVLFPRFTDFVVSSGNSLFSYPGEDLLKDYTLGVVWAALLFLTLCFWPNLHGDRKTLLAIWAAKCVVSLGLGLIFEQQYGLDGDGYFTNAIDPNFAFAGFRPGLGTENIQQLTWLHLHLVPNSYHAAKVGFSMIGLIALYQFYKAAETILGRKDPRLLVCVALYPSILLWSSTLGKDAPMLLGVSLFVRGVVIWTLQRRWCGLLLVIGGCTIASFIRPWYLLMMLAPFAAMSFLGGRRSVSRWLFALCAGAALLYVFHGLRTKWGISGMEDLVERRSLATTSFVGGGSTLQIAQIEGVGGWALNAPAGVFMALFRPLPFEIPSMFGLIQGLENLFLLFLFLRATWRTRLQELSEPLVLGAGLFVLIWAFSYGLVTYNLGSLARYRLQILPVFLGLLLYLGRRRVGAGSAQQ